MCLGIPGQVVEIVDPAEHKAIAEVEGVRREISVGLVLGDEGGLSVGDWVLIHVGFAMSVIDEEEAASTLEFMRGLGELFDDEVEQFRESTPL